MPTPTSLTLNTIREGDPNSPAVVILHGLFGSATNWRSISRRLSSQYHVVAMDLRNHGDSPWSEEMDYPKMAGDVVNTIVQLGVRRPALIGHSMGGKTAMAVVQQNLIHVSGLVVADIAPIAYQHDHEEFIAAMESLDLAMIRSRSDADRLMAAHIAETGVRQFLLQNLVRDNGAYRWRIHLEAIRRNLPGLLGWEITQSSEQKALFIAGGRSPYIKPSGRDAIHTLYSRATIETIAEAGHWLHAEQPQVFTGLVQEFLESAHSTH